jgi:hypothetical protein
MMPGFYQPAHMVSGPAYNAGFRLVSSALCVALAAYGITVALRFPLLQYGVVMQLLLLGAALMLGVSYYWFLRSTVTIDHRGIRQTWMFNREVEWRDVRSAKMLGIPYLSWLFPPRLLVRTGNSYVVFNGGTRELLIEFAKISLAYQMKP